MDFSKFVEVYGGWIGFLLYFMYNRLWPFITKRSTGEQEFEHAMESRRVTAQEKVASAVETLAINMTQTNERIATIMTNQAMMMQKQDTTYQFLIEAVGDMKAATGADKRKGD